MESECYGVYHSFKGVVNGCGTTNFLFTTGMEFSEWYEFFIFPGKSLVYICCSLIVTYSINSNTGVSLLPGSYGVGGIF